jgi:hypothetical protein
VCSKVVQALSVPKKDQGRYQLGPLSEIRNLSCEFHIPLFGDLLDENYSAVPSCQALDIHIQIRDDQWDEEPRHTIEIFTKEVDDVGWSKIQRYGNCIALVRGDSLTQSHGFGKLVDPQWIDLE